MKRLTWSWSFTVTLFLFGGTPTYASLNGYHVIVDAGHGPTDSGAIGWNNVVIPERNDPIFFSDYNGDGKPAFQVWTRLSEDYILRDPRFNPHNYMYILNDRTHLPCQPPYERDITLQIVNRVIALAGQAGATTYLIGRDQKAGGRCSEANNIAAGIRTPENSNNVVPNPR